jgi:hypothetical protein
MSKKLIAVAAAAALALTGLVAVPANATAFSVAVTGAINNTNVASLSTNALEAYVPSRDVLRLNEPNNVNSGTVVRFEVTTTAASQVVTATSTGGVKIVQQAQLDLATSTTATGTQSTSGTSDGSSKISFYAYNTSTTAGTITISQGATNSKTFFVNGVTQNVNAYKLTLTGPATAAIDGTVTITGQLFDMFGNVIKTDLKGNITSTAIGGTVGTSTITFNSTTWVYTIKHTARDDAGAMAISVVYSAPLSATAVTAFGAKSTTAFYSIAAVDLAAQVTALTAQVAALKADYNALAKRWNDRLAAKKAPKKAVATK